MIYVFTVYPLKNNISNLHQIYKRSANNKMVRSSLWTRLASLLGFGFTAEVEVATSLNILSTSANSCTIKLIRKRKTNSININCKKLIMWIEHAFYLQYFHINTIQNGCRIKIHLNKHFNNNFNLRLSCNLEDLQFGPLMGTTEHQILASHHRHPVGSCILCKFCPAALEKPEPATLSLRLAYAGF